LLGFDVDGFLARGGVGDLAGRRVGGGRVGRAVLHAVLEALDGAAQVGADVLELLGAEDQTTISSTISQCQMENEPMVRLLAPGESGAST
jgi:hypothetical protein